MHYTGKGHHSVSELEKIIHEFKEKEHYINAPYAEGCLHRVINLLGTLENLTNTQLEDLEFIELYFKKVLKKETV